MVRPLGDRKIEITDEVLKRVETLAGLGLSVKNIGAVLEISMSTFYKYKDENPEFLEAFERGVGKARAMVANALLKNCEKGDLASIKWFEMTRYGLSEKTDSTQNHIVNVEPFEKYVARLRGVEYGTKRQIEEDVNESEEQVDHTEPCVSPGIGISRTDGVSDK